MRKGALGLAGRSWRRWARGWMLAGMAVGSLAVASAHDVFTAYVQHRVHLTMGAEHLDLTLDMTFFEEWSLKERREMDADGNSRISRTEVEVYLKKRAPDWLKQVRLLAAGRELPLAALYEPEVDLLGSDRAAPAHHRLRLFFFASTPADLQAGDEIVIESGLWAQAKGLAALLAEGRDNGALEPDKPGDANMAPSLPGQTRQFKIRCVRPPSAERAAKTSLQPPGESRPAINPRQP